MTDLIDDLAEKARDALFQYGKEAGAVAIPSSAALRAVLSAVVPEIVERCADGVWAERSQSVSVQDPLVLLEMLLRFGKSPDGAVESDFRRSIITMQRRVASLEADIAKLRHEPSAEHWL